MQFEPDLDLEWALGLDREIAFTRPPESVYLAGPMRGLPDYNFPAFKAATADLRARGISVFSPAERDVRKRRDPRKIGELRLRDYMIDDLPAICRSDAVVVLPGWRKSTGAKLEVHVAKVCEIPVLRYPDLEPVA